MSGELVESERPAEPGRPGGAAEGGRSGAREGRRAEARRGLGAGGGSATAYPAAVDRLIVSLARLPGIGRRSAERLALHLLKAGPEEAEGLARAIDEVRRSIRNCAVCFNLTEAPLCAICADERRDRGVVLVAEQPRDVLALEQTGMYRGAYHVLLGRISPLEGVGPGDLTIAALLERVDEPAKNCGGVPVREVILGLNPTLEGDGTAMHLAQELRRHGVRVSRLARGLPVGSTLEYASKAVLADALEGRRDVD